MATADPTRRAKGIGQALADRTVVQQRAKATGAEVGAARGSQEGAGSLPDRSLRSIPRRGITGPWGSSAARHLTPASPR